MGLQQQYSTILRNNLPRCLLYTMNQVNVLLVSSTSVATEVTTVHIRIVEYR
jgi:hypothetical protein